jgi:hypothetical protein
VEKRLEEEGFTTNESKSIWKASKVKFLGHIVGEGQIQPDPAKIEA